MRRSETGGRLEKVPESQQAFGRKLVEIVWICLDIRKVIALNAAALIKAFPNEFTSLNVLDKHLLCYLVNKASVKGQALRKGELWIGNGYGRLVGLA
jgi:hypothetical protein